MGKIQAMNRTILFTSLVLFAIAMTACKSKKDSIRVAGDSPLFYLSKGACFGKCPMFEMTVYGNGRAEYVGKNFTDKLGKYEKKLTADNLKSLKQIFSDSKFSEFPTSYKSNIADLPMIKIGFNSGDSLKVVSGKENRPDELLKLQIELEKVADAGGWELIDSYENVVKSDQKAEVVIIKEEIILEPQSGTLLAKWIKNYEEFEVRLIKKIAPELNYFLITYNRDLIKSDDMLRLLIDDPAIKSAEFNKKTSQRGSSR